MQNMAKSHVQSTRRVSFYTLALFLEVPGCRGRTPVYVSVVSMTYPLVLVLCGTEERYRLPFGTNEGE